MITCNTLLFILILFHLYLILFVDSFCMFFIYGLYQLLFTYLLFEMNLFL